MNRLRQLLLHLALHPDRANLLVAEEMNETDVLFVQAHRDEAHNLLRSTQMDASGFYTCFPRALEAEIRASSATVLSIEVTAPTRFAKPVRLHAQAKIGDLSWIAYRAQHVGVMARSEPRVRVVSLLVDSLGCMAFDWDRLTEKERDRLLTATFSAKLVIGHDLSKAFSWLFYETECRPSMMLDTMLLVQHLRPTLLIRPFVQAAAATSDETSSAEDLICSYEGRSSLEENYVFSCFSMAPQACMQEPTSWSLSYLSVAHHDHCRERLTATQQLAHKLLPGCDVDFLRQRAPFYSWYAKATVRLAEAHVRGVPFAITTKAFQEVDLAPAQATQLRKLKQLARRDGRLHSLISFNTVTGRTTSRSPSLQNLPANIGWRSLIAAEPGHAILSLDYAAIELRVAAALASRCIADLRERLRRDENDDWFLKHLRRGVNSRVELLMPNCQAPHDADWYGSAIRASAQRVFRRKSQVLMAAFQQGIDPHLVTAVSFASRKGEIKLDGSAALTWLMVMSPDEMEVWQEKLKLQRRAAKACNFGLLYGMSPQGLHGYGANNYGLTWTLDEAAAAHDTWFSLYPELRLWQLWTRYCQSRVLRSSIRVWNRDLRHTVDPGKPVRLYKSATLAGRPIAALSSEHKALAYQGQGSGADILALAIALLPEHVSRMLLFPVHDELVLHVPLSQKLEVQDIVEGTMQIAAERVLGGEMPIKVDLALGHTWS
jgi:hypothetical protein